MLDRVITKDDWIDGFSILTGRARGYLRSMVVFQDADREETIDQFQIIPHRSRRVVLTRVIHQKVHKSELSGDPRAIAEYEIPGRPELQAVFIDVLKLSRVHLDGLRLASRLPAELQLRMFDYLGDEFPAVTLGETSPAAMAASVIGSDQNLQAAYVESVLKREVLKVDLSELPLDIIVRRFQNGWQETRQLSLLIECGFNDTAEEFVDGVMSIMSILPKLRLVTFQLRQDLPPAFIRQDNDEGEEYWVPFPGRQWASARVYHISESTIRTALTDVEWNEMFRA